MAVQAPKQGPDYRLELSKLVNGYLAVLEWSPARLAKMSGQSKATISRITSYKPGRDPYYRPELKTIQAIAQALKLTPEQRRELFYTAFPEFYVWEEAAEQGYSVNETNDLLYDRGLPLLTSDK